MSAGAHLQPVETNDLPEYPISCQERLDSHYFLQWNLKRWRGSEFRKKVDPEVGWHGFNLFCIAQDATPVGTLPVDDVQLAFDLHLPLEQWRALMKREVTPLHGWYRVLCDNGEIRLAHAVVTEVAVTALNSKRANAQRNADERMRKRIQTISKSLSDNVPGGKNIARNDEWLNKISDWVDATYPGGSATTKRIIEAWEALSMQD